MVDERAKEKPQDHPEDNTRHQSPCEQPARGDLSAP